MNLSLGSMFAGIGGMELGFEATGRIETQWQVEIDDYANQILSKHWPTVARWKDVRTFPPRPVKDWRVDIIAGGFPCQDVSSANGKAEGLDGDRSGLFEEIIRVARILKPKAIVMENVAALYVRGLDRVLGELAAIGFDSEWHCVSAASVGAPHRRDRVFIIATSTNAHQPQRERSRLSGRVHSEHGHADCSSTFSATEMADPDGKRSPRSRLHGRSEHSETNENRKADRTIFSSKGRENHWHAEPGVGRVADGIPCRVDRLKCLGNAIVPQVAQVIGYRLLEILESKK